MSGEPAWIELMFKRQNRYHCFATPFILRLNAEQVEETVSQIPDGRRELREVALQRLGSDDIDWIVISLLALFVVGNAEDAMKVEPLTIHADEYVKKAAKNCLFELGKRQ